jgi:hypothetical protein
MMTTPVEGAVELLWFDALANSCAPSDEEYRVEALHSTMHAMTLNKSKHDEHNTVGIPTIYLIEEFDKLEYEGPSVGPARTIRDAKN